MSVGVDVGANDMIFIVLPETSSFIYAANRVRDDKKFLHVNRLSAELPKTSRKPLNNLIGLWSKSINMANGVIPAYHGVRGLTRLMKKYTGNTEQFVQFPYTSLKVKLFIMPQPLSTTISVRRDDATNRDERST